MALDDTTRRSLFSRLGLTAAGLVLGSRAAAAQPSPGTFRPARHEQDAWLDAMPGIHRTIIDAATVSGAAESVLYANNLYVANGRGYALPERDIAIVICLRHFATAFAFDDAIWGKYGPPLSAFLRFTDPKTKQAPSANLLTVSGYGMEMPNLNNTLPSITARGAKFAVCEMATRMIAGQIARATGGATDAIAKELAAHLIPESRMVTAGVVAINRAQEYGFTLLTAL